MAEKLSKPPRTWSLSTERPVDSGVNAERAEPRSASALQLVRGSRFEIFEHFTHSIPKQTGRSVVIRVRAALRLGNDGVDHAELEAVNRVGPEGGGRLLRLARIAPENGCCALGRDDGVDRVLLHQDAIGNRRCDRAAGAALTDDAGDDRDTETRHPCLRVG